MVAEHALMAAHGDGKKQIWITEFGAPTNGPDSANYVSESDQAQIATDSVNLFKSYSWAGPMFWYNYTDTGTSTSTNENFFGLVRSDGSQKPAYAAFEQAISGN
jgi:exo-beta-1,3-glucanase (GH17 family)